MCRTCGLYLLKFRCGRGREDSLEVRSKDPWEKEGVEEGGGRGWHHVSNLGIRAARESGQQHLKCVATMLKKNMRDINRANPSGSAPWVAF